MRVLPTGHSDAKRSNLPGFFKADVTAPDSLTKALIDIDSVVHAAGLAHQFRDVRKQPPFIKVNVKGTENVARAALQAGVSHFILISSVSVYGRHGPKSCDEETKCDPQEPYAQSKYHAEERAIEVLKGSKVSLTILRLATVYGEGDPGNVARLMRMIDRGRFVWVGDGSNRKSLIHRDDVARACVYVLRQAPDGINTYNVVGSVNTMSEIVSGLASALGKGLPRWRIPPRVAKTMAISFDRISRRGKRNGRFERSLNKWVENDVYDGSKFDDKFSFAPETSLIEGLKREVEWYRQNREP